MRILKLPNFNKYILSEDGDYFRINGKTLFNTKEELVKSLFYLNEMKYEVPLFQIYNEIVESPEFKNPEDIEELFPEYLV